MEINRVILPEMARAMADSTVSAIARRIEQGQARSATPVGMSIGGQSSLAAALSTHGEALNEDRRDLREMLSGSGFTLPLNAVDGTVGRSPATFWASGDYRDLSGESGDLDWDGNLSGVHLGVDARLRENLLGGVAVSWLQGDLDYKDDSDAGKGEYEIDMTSAHPYVGWSAGELLDLWATVGYGEGEVKITPEGGATRSSDIEMRTVGGGGSGKLLERGATTVRLKGEALQTTLEVDGGDLEALEVDGTRLRMTVEASQSRTLVDGALFEPSLEAGVRYDGGDGETGTGAEVGGRLNYRNPATRITAEGSVRALLGHSGGYKEWGIQGRLALQPGADGQGLSFSLSPGYGDSGNGIRELWQQGLRGENDDNVADYSGRMDTRLGYGLSFALNGHDGVLTPYGEMTLGGTDSYRLGMNWQVGTGFDMNLVGERREPDGGPVGHTVLLEGAMRF